MAWTAPMTATANSAFTAAQFNTHVRDNLLETAPAKATQSGQLFVASGANALAARTPAASTVTTTQTTTSTSYTDLSTGGPEITVSTGARALWWLHVKGRNVTNANFAVAASVAVSGATTIAASDSPRSVVIDGLPADQALSGMVAYMETALTPGANTFTVKYKVWTTGTAGFGDRILMVIPL